MSTPVYSFAVIPGTTPGLSNNETAIKITESGSTQNLHVAASVTTTAGSDGNPVVIARVRVIMPNGSPALDSNGNPVLTRYGISATPAIVTACTNMAGVEKAVLMVALGGACAPLVVDAATAARASIINRALTALALQPVSVASLL